MEGNFLSRYNNRISQFEDLKRSDPKNSKLYDRQMADYMLSCIPFISQYTLEFKESGCGGEEDDGGDAAVFGAKITKGVQKNQIYRDYLAKVENVAITAVATTTVATTAANADHPKLSAAALRTQKNNGAHDYTEYSCSACKSLEVFHCAVTSDLICTKCGMASQIILASNLSYKEEHEHEIVFTYSYKRENHFNEWISQFQAQETTNIPEAVISQLRSEFKKQKIKNLKEITHAKVRTLLKKLRFNKYYEHVPYIANMLNGVRPPTMTNELEAKLRKMFDQIQEPFNTHCPKDRKNFLSYAYVIYKFCELLGEDAYLPCFPLLKSKEKLYQQDLIWKKICGTLRWEFIKTI